MLENNQTTSTFYL